LLFNFSCRKYKQLLYHVANLQFNLSMFLNYRDKINE